MKSPAENNKKIIVQTRDRTYVKVETGFFNDDCFIFGGTSMLSGTSFIAGQKAYTFIGKGFGDKEFRFTIVNYVLLETDIYACYMTDSYLKENISASLTQDKPIEKIEDLPCFRSTSDLKRRIEALKRKLLHIEVLLHEVEVEPEKKLTVSKKQKKQN